MNKSEQLTIPMNDCNVDCPLHFKSAGGAGYGVLISPLFGIKWNYKIEYLKVDGESNLSYNKLLREICMYIDSLKNVNWKVQIIQTYHKNRIITIWIELIIEDPWIRLSLSINITKFKCRSSPPPPIATPLTLLPWTSATLPVAHHIGLAPPISSLDHHISHPVALCRSCRGPPAKLQHGCDLHILVGTRQESIVCTRQYTCHCASTKGYY